MAGPPGGARGVRPLHQDGGSMLPPVTGARPRFVVCEDGTEYLERFSRFLGDDFTFVAAADFESARDGAAGADGLLLDLDFRRTPPDRLIDERGARAGGLDPERRRRLAETQGILILRQLGATGIALPAGVFSGLPDEKPARFFWGPPGPPASGAGPPRHPP